MAPPNKVKEAFKPNQDEAWAIKRFRIKSIHDVEGFEVSEGQRRKEWTKRLSQFRKKFENYMEIFKDVARDVQKLDDEGINNTYETFLKEHTKLNHATTAQPFERQGLPGQQLDTCIKFMVDLVKELKRVEKSRK